jgi:hypothetical protein
MSTGTNLASTPFYEGMFTPDEITKIQRSPLWAILLGAHHTFGRRVMITRFSQLFGSQDCEATLGTSWGLNVFHIRLYGGNYTLSTFNCPAGSNSSLAQRLTTTRPRYLQINKRIPELSTRIDESYIKLLGQFNSAAKWVGEFYRPAKIYRTHLDIDSEQYVLGMLAGRISDLRNAPNEVRNRIMEADSLYKEYEKMTAVARKKLADMFGMVKWFVCRIPDTGYLVGSVQTASLFSVSITTNTYATPPSVILSDVPKLYRSLSDTPNELQAALTFCKLARDGSGKQYSYNDPQRFIPQINNTIFEDAGAIAWGYEGSDWFMCDKQ